MDLPGITGEARRWFALAIGSLVIAGLLSLAVVVGRLPVIAPLIGDPLFFKRCLVVHVDLALVVWFYGFLAGLMATRTGVRAGWIGTASFLSAVGGIGLMLAGSLQRGAEPILANYVPVIASPLFTAGLAAFAIGILFYFLRTLTEPDANSTATLPTGAGLGIRAAALLAIVAATTFISARAGLPSGLDPTTRAEFLAWGPGHVLQAGNAAAMLAIWLWLVARATGRPLLSSAAARGIFALLVVPQLVMPLLTVRGTLDGLYHTGATQLMRWGIFPAVGLVLVLVIRRLWKDRANPGSPEARVARAGLLASTSLALLGMVLGALIRSSTTLVPAHYHAALGAVTVSFMTAAYLVASRVRQDESTGAFANGLWRAARRQLVLFGCGQTVFVLGFAIGGAYGLGRKTYAAEQQVRGAGELFGLAIMGIGGLLAVAGGLWFLFLLIQEMRGWTHGHDHRPHKNLLPESP